MQSGHFPHHRHALRGRRILVVEDEALVAMLVEDELADAGAEVIGPASSVDQALDLVERMAATGRGLHAAVLDINLQGTMVSPVADRLAELGVPIVFATGYGHGCNRGAHGAAPLLMKPFGSDELIAAIEELGAVAA